MANATKLLQDFDLAGPAERQEIIRGLVVRISVDEAKCLAKARHKHDLFGHDQLPAELRLMIVQYLDISDIFNCTFLVCRKWKDLFLGFMEMAEDVLHKWFPCFYNRDMPAEDMMDMFSQAITKRYLRDSGRFQTRLNYRFAKSDGEYPIGRIEGLQQGHTYKDLTCSATSSKSPEISGSTATKYLYAEGRLAWQLKESDPGSFAIYLQDLHRSHAQNFCVFQLPGQLVQGIKLKLEALGNELLVASVVGQRRLYAWNHQTQTNDSVTLPATLARCMTQGQSVLMVTVQGELFLWTFQRGVAQVDLSTMPQDREAYCGPSMPPQIPSPPLTKGSVQGATYFFHRLDTQVFFMATYDDDEDPDWIYVYEFRGKLCSRVFTYSFASPIEIITRESSTWDKLGVCDDRFESSAFPDLMAKKADAHGTYVLLVLRGRLDGHLRHLYVMFNTLGTTFSSRLFEPPPDYISRLGDPALVWNGQLYLNAVQLGTLQDQASYPSPLLVLQSLKAGAPPKEMWHITQWKEDQPKVTPSSIKKDELQLRSIQEQMLTSSLMQQPEACRTSSTPKKDIVRYQDISQAYPHATDIQSYLSGMSYMFSFYGGECSSTGPHTAHCKRSSPATLSGELPFNYVSHTGNEPWRPMHAKAIFGDDDFVVVVSPQEDLYTIFAVDPDRKMAKALIESPDGSGV
ncbi:hypothetical protein VMCG_04295 [Cytospora schulzeri]|uniref:F-box domain-containing protein n=1 Tax=Cytospora schulzeri TaxID=448051 RepID=A0A423WSP0_9PEZI|nr:hypothetical protein VMCG_04295 [Valsa malicola]